MTLPPGDEVKTTRSTKSRGAHNSQVPQVFSHPFVEPVTTATVLIRLVLPLTPRLVPLMDSEALEGGRPLQARVRDLSIVVSVGSSSW